MIRESADLTRRCFVRIGAMAICAMAEIRAFSQRKPESASRRSLFDGKSLDGWIQVESNATILPASSIADPEAFAARLAHGQEPLSVFLREQLDNLVKIDLSTYCAANPNAAALLQATVKEISQVLRGPGISPKSVSAELRCVRRRRLC